MLFHSLPISVSVLWSPPVHHVFILHSFDDNKQVYSLFQLYYGFNVLGYLHLYSSLLVLHKHQAQRFEALVLISFHPENVIKTTLKKVSLVEDISH